MKKTASKSLAVLMSLPILSACTTTNRWFTETNAVDEVGTYQLINRETFEPINLPAIIYSDQGVKQTPHEHGRRRHSMHHCIQLNSHNNHPPEMVQIAGECIDNALSDFSNSYRGIQGEVPITARNRIQDRVLAASTQRCNAYKAGLQRTFSRTNFGLGVLSTVSGIAGSTIPGVQASKNLSALAGAFSGARAEWNQSFLANLTVNVIVDGIESKQKETLATITKVEQKKKLTDYSLDAAIRDALQYHGQCTVVTRMQVAANAIRMRDDPGMDAGFKIIAKATATKKLLEGKFDLTELNAISQFDAQNIPFAWTDSMSTFNGSVQANINLLSRVDEINQLNETLTAILEIKKLEAQNFSDLKSDLTNLISTGKGLVESLQKMVTSSSYFDLKLRAAMTKPEDSSNSGAASQTNSLKYAASSNFFKATFIVISEDLKFVKDSCFPTFSKFKTELNLEQDTSNKSYDEYSRLAKETKDKMKKLTEKVNAIQSQFSQVTP